MQPGAVTGRSVSRYIDIAGIAANCEVDGVSVLLVSSHSGTKVHHHRQKNCAALLKQYEFERCVCKQNCAAHSPSPPLKEHVCGVYGNQWQWRNAARYRNLKTQQRVTCQCEQRLPTPEASWPWQACGHCISTLVHAYQINNHPSHLRVQGCG